MESGGRPRRDPGDRPRQRASGASSPRACATRSAWPGSPQSGALWVAVNERDELGDDLVPDYMTSVQDGGFYGWPYSYYGQPCRRAGQAAAAGPGRQGASRPTTRWARTPRRWAWPSTTATAFPARYRGGAFIGQHGSWNRSEPVRLQGDLRAVRRRPPGRPAGGRPDRLPRRGRPGAGPPGRRGGRRHGRAAGGGRCRQRDLARVAPRGRRTGAPAARVSLGDATARARGECHWLGIGAA